VTRFLVGRLLQTLVVLWGVSSLVFLILHLSGDPAALMVPQGAPASAIARMRHALGFDLPLYVQYLRFLGGLVRGDLGISYVQDAPALQLVLGRLPYTAELAGAAFALALLVGIPVGILGGTAPNGTADRLTLPLVLVGQAMPTFWTGLLLILVFSVHWHLLPSSGSGTAASLVLPAVTLGSLSIATIARMTRSAVAQELGCEYVRTARAKGAGTARVITRHILRNAAIPVVSIAGLEVASLLGGAVITEAIFAWPGIGQLARASSAARDYTVVQAVVLVGAAIFTLANLVTDVLYSLLDPRIEIAGGSLE
jgi:peptide/nickel transport system permease protein